MSSMSVLEATAQIVSSALRQRDNFLNAEYGKQVAEFTEAVYTRLAKLEFEPEEE